MASEARRLRELQIAKRRATALLVAVTAVFLLLAILTPEGGGWGYARAAAEAGMVGGLADWFAVTALFRHPLGVPIPHTAIIRERKDQFGETLGEFVQQNFLSADAISERVATANVVPRAADWLADAANAQRTSARAAELAVSIADLVHEDEVRRLVDQQLERAVEVLPLAPLAGRALRLMTEGQRHDELMDSLLRGVQRALEDNRDAFRARFAERTPRWMPKTVDDRIFDRLFEGVQATLDEVNRDPDHELRNQFDAWLAQLVERLEHSPEVRDRAEQLKRDVLASPELRRWSSSLWGELKEVLRDQADDPSSELRKRLAELVCAAGQRLQYDTELQRAAERLVESGARSAATQFRGDIAALVSGTIARWDADETSYRLELLLGRDLQFIRINGTVVGALAGVVIHAVADLLS